MHVPYQPAGSLLDQHFEDSGMEVVAPCDLEKGQEACLREAA